MPESEKPAFDVKKFLAGAGSGRENVELRESQILFSQGMAADSVIYLQSGRAKLTVVSKSGKEATKTHLASGDFVMEILLPEIGEDRLAAMIGTSESAISFFMNRFRELGFISYDRRIQVHQSLLEVVLHDRLPGNNTATPEIAALAR
jgi:hypothetical protein